MRKHYRVSEFDWKTWRIDIYHDGVRVGSESYLRIQDDEFHDRLDWLEAQGYIYGYTIEEVENAKKLYEHKLKNIIKVKENESVMCKTRKELNEFLTEIKELRQKENQLIENFETSTGDFSEIFHYIIKRSLEGWTYCTLTHETVSKEQAEALRKMGFYVTEKFNCFDVLCGYRIHWDLWEDEE